MVSLTIKHGYLWRVLGRAAEYNRFVFVPVLGELYDGINIRPYRRPEETPTFPLTDYIDNQLPKIINRCRHKCGKIADAVWVRGRIPAIFGFTPLSLPFADYKYALLEQTFMACQQSSVNHDWVAYPFVCEDYDLSVGLRFIPDTSLTEVYQSIAKAFWELLLLEPNHVQPFCDGYIHYNELDDEEWLLVALKNRRCIIDFSDSIDF
ncbi:hypothetical protein [Nostoc sp. FACHB-190]|uniref:hypothetical protein n=1 Tax=Nostoc sp. FACHB-190 TaxID=2692838 RepID=UPI0016873186|nr:hypothetical protein [Nostoc sp. FACHB-190]MBD2302121.1 hypothetical protein [Nostoc sp. FACHB-190]